MVRIHIGKKPPKGYKEISSIHLGRGMWMFSLEKDDDKQTVRN
jgi:hypothetical protein